MKFSEKLEQFLNSIGLNPNPSVTHRGYQLVISVFKRDRDASFECKLRCVTYQVKQHLVVSFLVTLDHNGHTVVYLSSQIQAL